MSQSQSSSLQHLSHLPIGIFDSGIGGVSIARNIKKTLPNESITYIADDLYAPYGEKSDSFITDRVIELGKQLTKMPVKAIVVACNTATVTAINALREQVNIPIIGVEPAIKPAALSSKNKKVGVMVTQATSVNERFHQLIHTYASGADVYIQPCPGLVELIEAPGDNTDEIHSLLQAFLSSFKTQNIDTLVLGCTHYPLVNQLIAEHLSADITIMDTAAPVTAQLQRKLVEFDLLNQASTTTNDYARDTFYTTGCDKALARKIEELWHHSVDVQPLTKITLA